MVCLAARVGVIRVDTSGYLHGHSVRDASLLLVHAPQQDAEGAQVPRARRHHLGHAYHITGTAQSTIIRSAESYIRVIPDSAVQ